MKKDYTVSHPHPNGAGFESVPMKLAYAKEEARNHKNSCEHDSDTPNHTILIDQYDLEQGELTGQYYELKGRKFIKHL